MKHRTATPAAGTFAPGLPARADKIGMATGAQRYYEEIGLAIPEASIAMPN